SSEALLRSIGAMASEGRVLLWSRFAPEQEVLAAEPIGGALQDVRQGEGAPSVRVVVNNAGGTKLDAYLEREVEYSGSPCPADTRQRRETQVTLNLRNGAPAAGLPDYVTNRADLSKPQSKRGSNRLIVAVYLSKGTGLGSATLDGEPFVVGGGRELGHSVVTFRVELEAQQARSVTLRLSEPAWRGQPRIESQPLLLEQINRLTLAPC
ncbi:MAG: hypothetical protein ACRC1H_01780, partial [Caldilineaceae bacterium]